MGSFAGALGASQINKKRSIQLCVEGSLTVWCVEKNVLRFDVHVAYAGGPEFFESPEELVHQVERSVMKPLLHGEVTGDLHSALTEIAVPTRKRRSRHERRYVERGRDKCKICSWRVRE